MFRSTRETERAFFPSSVHGYHSQIVQSRRHLHTEMSKATTSAQDDQPVAVPDFRVDFGERASHGDTCAEQRGSDLVCNLVGYPGEVTGIGDDVLLQGPGLRAAGVFLLRASMCVAPPAQKTITAGAVEPLDTHSGTQKRRVGVLTSLYDRAHAFVAHDVLIGAVPEDGADLRAAAESRVPPVSMADLSSARGDKGPYQIPLYDNFTKTSLAPGLPTSTSFRMIMRPLGPGFMITAAV
ncbi:hypothetical protein TruAng_000030 [Truncatella angustata]|nr:hypothetical protein TruAng_000030 [Truncatella angustata]